MTLAIGVLALRKRIADGMPAFGSCAGMIMLADELLDAVPGQQTLQGIDMTVQRNAFGRQVDSFGTDLELAGLSSRPQSPFRAIFIRAPGWSRPGTIRSWSVLVLFSRLPRCRRPRRRRDLLRAAPR